MEAAKESRNGDAAAGRAFGRSGGMQKRSDGAGIPQSSDEMAAAVGSACCYCEDRFGACGGRIARRMRTVRSAVAGVSARARGGRPARGA